VLPCGIAAYFLTVFPIAKITALPFFSAHAQDLFSQSLHSLIGPWAFVYFGAKVAPRAHFVTALCLTVLNGMLVAAVVTAALIQQVPSQRMWYVCGTSLAGIIVTLFVTFGFHRDEHHESAVLDLFGE
jgi:hypothetical protein